MTRRAFVATPALALAQSTPLTRFQVACMTLPYAQFPLERALKGIAGAGYKFVAWGTTHKESDGTQRQMMPVDAPGREARELGRRCRDLGLEPVMMFSTVFLELDSAPDAHARRVEQAAEAGIPFVLTFGRTQRGEYDKVIQALKSVGPKARAAKVTVVVKQHGGNSATGKDCAKIIADTADEGVKICYDAGNVMDYESHDPIPDILTCIKDIRAFAIKDHRDTPKDQDCGPGFGEIDHYKLLMPVARTGLTMPLACENIFEPLVPRPSTAEGIDSLARRAREFVETVIRGIQS